MITLTPIGYVRNSRNDRRDDYWGGVVSTIELSDEFGAESLQGLTDFSHAEVLFYFDRVDDDEIVYDSRHPRDNTAWPRMGVFAQRGKNRPNRLGATIVQVLQAEGKTLTVAGLDAMDGTPVLDIKPVMRGFLPREEVRQPEWANELMAHYWEREG